MDSKQRVAEEDAVIRDVNIWLTGSAQYPFLSGTLRGEGAGTPMGVLMMHPMWGSSCICAPLKVCHSPAVLTAETFCLNAATVEDFPEELRPRRHGAPHSPAFHKWQAKLIDEAQR